MNRTIAVAFSTVFLGMAGVAVAQDKKPMDKPAGAPPAASAPMAPAPTPPDVAAWLKGFEGKWKCETTFVAGSMGPGSPEMKLKGAVQMKLALGGKWMTGVYEVKKTKDFPGMTANFNVGYEPGTKQIVFTGVDSMGGVSLSMGPLSGDTAITTGEQHMMGMKMKIRETMTRKSDKEAYHKIESDMGKGFALMGEDTCKK